MESQISKYAGVMTKNGTHDCDDHAQIVIAGPFDINLSKNQNHRIYTHTR